MAGEKHFVWLTATCYPRRGPVLERGKEYAVADYGEDIVAYWVSQKAARYVTEKKPKADEARG